MKFVEQTTMSIPEGAVLKVTSNVIVGTQTNWAMIVEDMEGDEMLVLLDVGTVEAIENIENGKIETTEGIYTITAVYANPVLYL